VRPHEVLGLTFTTKAAGELAGRIRGALHDAGILPDGAARDRDAEEAEVLEPTVATYNAYAAALLTEHGLRIGHEPDTRVITDAARYQLAARVIGRHTGPVQHLSDHPPTVIGYLLALDAQLSEHLVSPADVLRLQDSLRPGFEEEIALEHRKTGRDRLHDVLRTFDRRTELVGLVEEYRRLKRALGLMEFSDQIELGARLARSRPEVGAEERSKFRVVLLDEYQDTSVAQALMLSSLFSGGTPEQGRGHPVTAVGDPNQAIYGWRGASVSNILRFGESFPAADGGTDAPAYALTVNRRSDRRILDLANRLARPLYAQFPMVKELEAAPGAAPGELRSSVHETYDEELAALAGQVREAHERFGSWREIGVLTRDNATAADVFTALSEADVPVEIVGLKGLLALPEVAEVVATLTLLQDLTANASLLLLLTGPRWAVGPRDLALLGRRAAELAGTRERGRGRSRSVDEELADAVAGADPTEVASLSDALDSPGDGGYSPEARERFALLSEELRRLRQHVGEPLLDLVRRIVDTIGIDVELASSVSAAARARRDNLDLFVKGVADFQAIDGEVSLPALLSYLEAEDEGGSGMDVATPTAADTVKLLTVHRAKGLEWDAVFLVGVAKEKFPTDRIRTKWTAGPGVLPFPLRGDAADLPRLRGCSVAALDELTRDSRVHEAQEELRLGYVAFTRPRHQLSVSSYLWTSSRKTPCGPSAYQQTMREFLDELVAAGELEGPLEPWPETPDRKAPNPLQATAPTAAWPPDQHTEEVERRLATAALVRAEIRRQAAGGPAPADEGLDPEEREVVATWDRELERLLEEARARVADEVEVPLPSSLSATSLAALRADPDGFADALARPMPRPPSPAARFGTRFHAWVERHFDRTRQELLVDPDELSGRADLGIDDDEELAELVARFEAGPFADRTEVEIEPSFALVLAGQVVRGRIDAVFAEDDGGWLVVDWKTSRAHTADPLQLAVYRLAWAELRGVPLSSVRAAFCYVREGVVEEHPGLPGRAELERLLAGEAQRKSAASATSTM
jgi:DNA helicase-2/ATP-dependent DNA helicase PcrA